MTNTFLKRLLTIISLTVITISGYSQCVPDLSINDAGIYPSSENIPCFVNGQFSSVDLTFKNFTSISSITIDSLRIDSITNMPCGGQYALGSTDRVLDSGESGCIRLSGNMNDVAGQYRLGIYITLWAGIAPAGISGEIGALGSQFGAGDLNFYLRLKNTAGASCPAIDTSSGATNRTAACQTLDVTGVQTGQSAIVEGVVYSDDNGNGVQDGLEPGIANRIIQTTNGNLAFSGGSGSYSILVDPGNIGISADVSGGYTATTNNPFQLTATGGGSYTVNFGIQPTAISTDLTVIAANSNFRPGFQSTVWVTAVNNGNTAISSTELSYTFAPVMTFVNASDFGQVNGQTVTWNILNLNPGETRTVNATFSLPPDISLVGTTLTTNAGISTSVNESNLNNNTYPLNITVTASYDPNDKTAFPQGDLSRSFVDSEAPLKYRIRFQNSGTDTAFNVVLRDTLDISKFDITSLKMLGASHDYSLTIEGGRYAVWEFNNILLPDENTNEPASHGYVMFEIDLLPGLTDGQEIRNTAGIYFDFNPVILTNTSVSKVDFSTGLQRELVADLKANIYPNPVNNLLHIEVADAQSISVQLFDLAGRQVLEELGTNRIALDVANIQTGVYLVKLSDEKGNTHYSRIAIE